MRLLKNGRIEKICKLSAIAIALIGTAHIALQFYSAWMTYQILQAQSGQQAGSFPTVTAEYYTYLMPNITSALESVVTTIFYVVILYTTGVVINAIFASTPDEEAANKGDETAITYEPLDDDEVIIESIDRRRSKRAEIRKTL